MITLFFEPQDALFFRDHRPFAGGSNFVARSRFPSPAVFYGCLRTALVQDTQPEIFRGGVRDIEAAVKAHLDGLGFAPMLRGPVLAHRTNNGQVHPLIEVPESLSTLSLPRLVNHTAEHAPTHLDLRISGEPRNTARLALDEQSPEKTTDKRLLTRTGLAQLLSARKVSDPETILWKDVVQSEYRTGIARDAGTGVVREGMLYQAEYWRFARGCGLAVECTGVIPDSLLNRLRDRLVPLGGRLGLARITVVNHRLFDPAPRGEQAWHLLLAPAPLDAAPVGELARLTTTRDPPEGGWDLARAQPKPLTPMLPRGTVFYTNHAPSEATHLPGTPSDKAQAGYGSLLTGVY